MYNLLFKNFAKHIELTPTEAAYVQTLFTLTTVKKRTKLLNPGEVCKSVYFVNRGCLRLYRVDKDGKEHIISFMPEDWWAVDIASFYSQLPATHFIDAIEETEVLILTYANQQLLYENVPKFERFFRILTQNGFILYQRRIMQNLSQTAEERYRSFRKRYPKLEPRIPQKDIASYLGVTPVFVSILRKRR